MPKKRWIVRGFWIGYRKYSATHRLRQARTGLIQIPILHHWRRLRAPMFEPRRQEGRVWARTRRKWSAKSQDLNTALIFWFFFIKEKEQYIAQTKLLTKQLLMFCSDIM
jgi:hypothetical protein